MPALDRPFAVFALSSLLLLAPVAHAQEPTWLDGPNPDNWNSPGMELPVAPPLEGEIDPRIIERERGPESPEEEALVANGWRLFAAAQSGWGVRLVIATASYDGMGRPWGYQAFVFVDGAYAGTLSPGLSNSRFDGALSDWRLFGASTLGAQFNRYADSDPLCCPSGRASAQYSIERTELGPVVSVLGAQSTWETPPAS